jgi:hypothetical protein
VNKKIKIFFAYRNLLLHLRAINPKKTKQMKKLFLTLTLASAVAFANAQDMTSKKGVPILPEANDWSISFDAVPVLNYFGHLANGHAGNSASMNWADPSGMTIVGKMMKDESTAYRAKIRIGMHSHSAESHVASTTTANATVINKTEWSKMNIGLGAGIQKYRGKGRLKGYYGAELGLGFGGSGYDTTYTYGNALDSLNPGPRTKEVTAGSMFGVNVRGFIGVEYFFAPKMSVGAEYGWSIGLNSTGEGETTYEAFGTTVNPSKTGGTSAFEIDTDIAGGAIWLSFYF